MRSPRRRAPSAVCIRHHITRQHHQIAAQMTTCAASPASCAACAGGCMSTSPPAPAPAIANAACRAARALPHAAATFAELSALLAAHLALLWAALRPRLPLGGCGQHGVHVSRWRAHVLQVSQELLPLRRRQRGCERRQQLLLRPRLHRRGHMRRADEQPRLRHRRRSFTARCGRSSRRCGCCFCVGHGTSRHRRPGGSRRQASPSRRR